MTKVKVSQHFGIVIRNDALRHKLLVLLKYLTPFTLLLLIGCGDAGRDEPAPTSTFATEPMKTPTLDVITQATGTTPATVRLTPTIAAITATPSPTPTSSPTPTAQPLEPMRLEAIRLCPEQRELDPADLALDTGNVLIVQLDDDPSRSLWLVDPNNPTPQLINYTTPEAGYFYRFQDVSPDGRWLLMYKWPADPELFELWIVAVDGSTQIQIGTVALRTSAIWSRQEQVYIIEHIDGWPAWKLSEVINPFTATREEFEPIPLPSPTYVHTVSFTSTIAWDGNHWLIHNHQTNRDEQIMPWLETEAWDRDPARLYAQVRIDFDSAVAGAGWVIVEKPYGFDLATGLDMSAFREATNYDAIMMPIYLPGGGLESRFFQTVNGNVLLFERYTPPWISEQSHFLYAFDVNDLILYDYCLDRDNAVSIRDALDDRFIAWTHFLGPTQRNPDEIVILDLETGYLARLPGAMNVVGWAFMDATIPPQP